MIFSKHTFVVWLSGLRTTTNSARNPPLLGHFQHRPSHHSLGESGSAERGSVVVSKILENDTYAYGFDAQTGEFGNLVTKGIVDPTKVVRVARSRAF
jgi:hypothetical protein